MENNVVGIERHIDDLGRIVIPREVRKKVGIVEGDSLELFVTVENTLIIRKAGTTKTDSFLVSKPEPEKIIYTFENIYDDNYRVVSITREQEKLLTWLCDNGYIGDDVNCDRGCPNCDDLTK